MNQNVIISFVARGGSSVGRAADGVVKSVLNVGRAAQQATAHLLSIGGQAVVKKLFHVEELAKRAAKALIGMGVATVTAYGGASIAATGFERSMRNVNSIVKANETGFARMSDNILKMATRIPQTAGNLAEGAYNVASAGFTKAAEVEAVLEASSKAAAAGLTETNVAATAIVTTLNSFGLAAGDAARVSDVLFKTVDAGQITFEQLSIQLSDFVGFAKASGSSLEETFATFAQMTIAMGNPAKAATGMAATLRQMIRPTEDLRTALDKLYGMTGQQAITTHGLTKVLQDLQKEAGGSSEAMGRFFQDSEALNGVLAFLSQTAGDTALNLEAFKNASDGMGVTQQVLAEQAKSYSYQMQQLKATLSSVAITFGQVLLPVLTGATKVLSTLAKAFIDLPQPIKWLITRGGFLIGTLGGIAAALKLLQLRTLLMTKALGPLAAAMGFPIFHTFSTKLITMARNATLTKGAFAALDARVAALKMRMIGFGAAFGTALVVIPLVGEAMDALHKRMNPQSMSKMGEAILELGRYSNTGGELVKQFGDNLEELGIKARLTAQSAEAFNWEVILGFNGDPRAARRDIDTLDKALADLFQQDPTSAVSAFHKLETEMKRQGVSAAKIEHAFGDYHAAVSGASLANKTATNTTELLGSEFLDVADSANAAGSSIKAMDRLTRGMSESAKKLATSMSSGVQGASAALQAAAGVQDKLRKASTKSTQTEQKADPVRDALDLEQATLGITRANRELVNAQEELNTLRNANPAERFAAMELDVADAYEAVAEAQDRVLDAEKELQEAREFDLVDEIRTAERELAASYDNTRRAELAVLDAHEALEEARRPQDVRTVEEAEIAVTRALMRQAEAAEEVIDAQKQLDEANDHGTPEEVAQSERRLTEAQISQKEAIWNLEDAQKALDDVRANGDQAERIEKAELDLRDAERALATEQDNAIATQESLNEMREFTNTEAITEAEKNLARAVRDVADADKAAAEAAEELRIERGRTKARDIEDAELRVAEAILATKEAHHRLAEVQKGEVGDAADEVIQDLDDIEISLDEFAEHLRQNTTDNQKWLNDIQTIAGKFGPAVAQIMADMGVEGRKATSELARGSKEDFQGMATEIEQAAVLGSNAVANAMVLGLGTARDKTRELTKATADALAEELGIGKTEALRILDDLGLGFNRFATSGIKETNTPGQYRYYVPGQGFTGATFQAEGTEDHRAQIAPAGAWRVWAEPETGGEAYIPLSISKRRRSTEILHKVAKKFGVETEAYEQGGIRVPMRQAFTAEGVKVDAEAVRGESTAVNTIQAIFRHWRAASSGDVGDIVALGKIIQSMGFRVSEHPGFGGVSAVHTPNSYHYRNRALDVNYYPSADEPVRLDSLAAYLRTVQGIKELIWRAPGHFNHLHVAMADGGIRRTTYDDGGYLEPGYTLAYNGTGQRELISPTPSSAGNVVTLSRGAVQVTVRAEAGVDQGRLATMVGQKVEAGVRTAINTLHREIRKN